LKKQGKNILFHCYQLGVLLLVVLFLSISVIQAFHSHNKVVRTEQSTTDDDTLSDSDQCKLCDYFTQKQSKQLYLSYAPVLLLPIPDPITFNTEVFVGNYKFTLQGFTNKGPPAFPI